VIEKESIIRIIQDYLQAIRQAGIQVSQAVLYGSWARGEARPESDIDLIVIAPNLTTYRIEI
jgi:predicted nucleotidyltransferase